MNSFKHYDISLIFLPASVWLLSLYTIPPGTSTSNLHTEPYQTHFIIDKAHLQSYTSENLQVNLSVSTPYAPTIVNNHVCVKQVRVIRSLLLKPPKR